MYRLPLWALTCEGSRDTPVGTPGREAYVTDGYGVLEAAFSGLKRFQPCGSASSVARIPRWLVPSPSVAQACAGVVMSASIHPSVQEEEKPLVAVLVAHLRFQFG